MKSLYITLLCLLVLSIQQVKSTSLHHAPQNKITYGNNSKAAKYYHIRGINIYTEQYGKGKPLVLIHGNGGNISSMGSIIPYFSKKYRVIAMDSRAHGKSIDKNDSLSFEMMSDDVSALLQEMKIKSAYVIGWSDGGIVAIEMALRHPDKVIKLASTGANITPDSTAFATGFWKESYLHYEKNKNLPKTTEQEKRDWKYFMLDWLYPNISLTELHKITTPSLIISGDRDLISLPHTLLIFQNIPKAQLWVVPNSGHATLIEHTADFCKTVDEFFNEK